MMSPEDRQLLFTALGFMAVTMKGDKTSGNGAAEAQDYATLIEEFCRTTVPEAFESDIFGQPDTPQPNVANAS